MSGHGNHAKDESLPTSIGLPDGREMVTGQSVPLPQRRFYGITSIDGVMTMRLSDYAGYGQLEVITETKWWRWRLGQ